MKDGFKSITIEPFNGYLDFQGPINPQKPTNNLVLKGDIHLHLSKAVKVKRASLKFVGSSRVCHKNTLDVVDISTPILPKLKTQIFSSTTNLGPGLVILPWEMEIPNIYPSSVMIKRASISYKIELSISLGLHRTVTAEYPIIIKRHLLPCLEVAPLVPTKLYTKTISTKFHYEIDAPRIVCTAQQSLPIAIKLLTIGTHKPVLSVRTQMIQVELYRCNTLPKTDADMTKFRTQLLGQKNSSSSTTSSTSKKGESNKYAKYTKHISPAIIHTLDETLPISSSQPLLLRHPLGEYIALGLESPLAAIYHQLEITFQFGAKFEDVRAKVPILVASAGPSPISTPPLSQQTTSTNVKQQNSVPLALYPFEKIPVLEPLFVMDESRLDYHHTASLRMPTPTPSSITASTDRGIVDDNEVADYLEIIANYRKRMRADRLTNQNNNNNNGSSNTTQMQSSAQLLRRTRSADLMIDTPTPDDPSELKKSIGHSSGSTSSSSHLLQIPQQTRHQRHLHPSIAPTHSKSTFAYPMDSSIPRYLREKRIITTTSSNTNIEMGSSGMWPRPDTKIPHQWRRRSSSQPYSSIDDITSISSTSISISSSNNIPPRPAKDPKRSLAYASTTASPSPSTSKSPLSYPGGLRTMVATAAAARALYSPPPPAVTRTDSASLDERTSHTNDFDDTSTTEASESSSCISSSSTASSYADSSCLSSVSPPDSFLYQPQSRPNSPAFSPAPGLPSSTALRPQNANPVALLEESFVPSSPASLVPAFHPFIDTPSQQQQQQQKQSSSSPSSSLHYTRNGRSANTMSVISTTQSSVIDPDEDIMQMMEAMAIQYRQQLEHKRLLEQHYTHAELPPIPSNTPSSSSSSSATAATITQRLDRPTTMYFGDESSEYSEDDDAEEEGSSEMNDDDDTSEDDDTTADSTSSTNNTNTTTNNSSNASIKGPPYQDLPADEPVCLCPKHGVIVPRR